MRCFKTHRVTLRVSCCYSWMREQHVLPGAVNSLFAPPIESRMKMFVPNPLFSTQTEDFLTPNQSMIEDGPPLLSSTPFNAAEDTTLTLSPAPVETSVRAARHSVATSFQQHHPVDMIVKNPLFGSGLCFKKVSHLSVYQLGSIQSFLFDRSTCK